MTVVIELGVITWKLGKDYVLSLVRELHPPTFEEFNSLP